MTDFLNVEIQSGEPISYGARKITPFAQAVQLKIPGLNGGLIWNRPVAVLVEYENGDQHVLPVPDVTRKTQIRIMGAALIIVLTSWVISQLIHNR